MPTVVRPVAREAATGAAPGSVDWRWARTGAGVIAAVGATGLSTIDAIDPLSQAGALPPGTSAALAVAVGVTVGSAGGLALLLVASVRVLLRRGRHRGRAAPLPGPRLPGMVPSGVQRPATRLRGEWGGSDRPCVHRR